jgi:sterol desaturase/sphingolipid hydroxylase (fatty acid hydroxylase superfamily)
VPASIWIAGAVAGPAYCAGFLTFYVAYEVLHRRSHTHSPRGMYGRWLRKHHFYHHFGNPKMNHGVTSPIWDIVFRTHARPEQVKVPRRLAMMWLTDSETGEIAEKYANDYVLTGRRRAIEATEDDVGRAFSNAAPVA